MAQQAKPIGIGHREFFRIQLMAASTRVKKTLPSLSTAGPSVKRWPPVHIRLTRRLMRRLMRRPTFPPRSNYAAPDRPAPTGDTAAHRIGLARRAN